MDALTQITDPVAERRLRARALRMGYVIRKGRDRHGDDRFLLVDVEANAVCSGLAHFATVEQINDYLDEHGPAPWKAHVRGDATKVAIAKIYEVTE